ncbi:MAG: hypothetical protein WC755_01865 [Candidatus Woesearchaeota archaeon]|jgi:Arc/MetJ-type ribon-helix-helix transcriptional regulator
MVKQNNQNTNDLIHIRVGKEIKEEMEKLIDSGLFTNQSEIAREGIRSIILKYRKEEDKNEK